jgi:hypothetical protein
MGRRDDRVRSVRLAAVLALFFLLPVEDGEAGEGRLEVGDLPSRSLLESVLSTAVRDASSRLSVPSCQQIFADFRDAAGHTLREKLDALGTTGQSYLDLLVFYDGHGMARCQDRHTFASTSPGSRVIYICAPQFREKQRRDPGLAAAMIIHEALHSLGLGENPPASKEITAGIVSRCGR